MRHMVYKFKRQFTSIQHFGIAAFLMSIRWLVLRAICYATLDVAAIKHNSTYDWLSNAALAGNALHLFRFLSQFGLTLLFAFIAIDDCQILGGHIGVKQWDASFGNGHRKGEDGEDFEEGNAQHWNKRKFEWANWIGELIQALWLDSRVGPVVKFSKYNPQ